jgi:intein/homing endonuclease
MIECQICHKKFLILQSHIKIHDITKEEYFSRFPKAPFVSDEFRRRAGMPARYKVNESFFDSWSPNMAYCLGLLLADGYILRQQRVKGKHIAGFALDSIDKELPNNIKQALETDAPVIETTPVKNKSGTITIRYRINIFNHALAKSLIAFGCQPKKSRTLTMPSLPSEQAPYFLRGYFEGDGSVSRPNRSIRPRKEVLLSFISGSKVFAIDLLKCLQVFDIGTTRKVYTSKNKKANYPHYRIVLGKLDAARFFRLAYSDLVSCPFYLKRKYNKFIEFGLKDYHGRIY